MREDRVKALSSLLKTFTISDVFRIEEKYDKQYIALFHLGKHLERANVFLSLIILNSISSYQLTGTGEQFWWEFSRYFSNKKPINNVAEEYIQFLISSKYNARLRQVKINRINKLKPFIAQFDNHIERYISKPTYLAANLARYLETKPNAKTIVFAVKMFHYGCRIANLTKKPLPYEIQIPVDTRIRYISSKLGIKKRIQEFWSKMSREVKIPPLHLDSLLWVALGCIKRNEETDEIKLQELIQFLRKIFSKNDQ